MRFLCIGDLVKPAHEVRRLYFIWCPREDSNLHAFRHIHLKDDCLPISTPGHKQDITESFDKIKARRLSAPGFDFILLRFFRSFFFCFWNNFVFHIFCFDFHFVSFRNKSKSFKFSSDFFCCLFS